MVKITESVLKIVTCNKPKWLTGLNQIGNGSWKTVFKYVFTVA